MYSCKQISQTGWSYTHVRYLLGSDLQTIVSWQIMHSFWTSWTSDTLSFPPESVFGLLEFRILLCSFSISSSYYSKEFFRDFPWLVESRELDLWRSKFWEALKLEIYNFFSEGLGSISPRAFIGSSSNFEWLMLQDSLILEVIEEALPLAWSTISCS